MSLLFLFPMVVDAGGSAGDDGDGVRRGGRIEIVKN